jgi:hypothetical protein
MIDCKHDLSIGAHAKLLGIGYALHSDRQGLCLSHCRGGCGKQIMAEAFARFGTPEIVNTDQGSQFAAEEFTEAVLAQSCKLSMDGLGS